MDVKNSYKFDVHKNVFPVELQRLTKLLQKSLDIRKGPLFACDLIDLGEQQLLFLFAHHLIVDLVSWRVILQDLEHFIVSGSVSSPVPMPFQKWCSLQTEYSHEYLSPEVAFPFTIPVADYAFWGMAGQSNLHADSVRANFILSEDITALLMSCCHTSLRTQPTDVFMSSIIHAFATTFPERNVATVFGEGHGREPWEADLDISQTVGWFTTLYPVHVPVDPQHDLVDTVRRTKDMRRAIPGKGWSYFASRYLNPEGRRRFGSHVNMEIVFNYFGLYQQLEREGGLLEQVPAGIEESVAGDVPRFSLIEISAEVERGRLRFTFVYNRHMRHQQRIREWIAACETKLNRVGVL
jgi:non-ribosomal peptide synthase protein (TIGR01720 family)